MFFLFINNINVAFVDCQFIWRFYSIAKSLLTTCQVEITNKKEFVKVALYKNIKVFIIQASFFTLKLIPRAQKV